MHILKNIDVYTVTLMALLWVFLIPLFWHAQINNAINPFVDVNHSGTAEKIAVVWLNDADATDGGQKDALVNVIRSVVNWVLGILWLIALLVLLYGGFQMVTAAWNEDQYGQWFKILKQAAFGLAMIGVARFIVSIIFFVLSLITSEENAVPAGTDS